MFSFTIVSILLIIKKSAQECLGNFIADHPSECILSEEEKEKYNYCCYEKEGRDDFGGCSLYGDSNQDKLEQKYQQYGRDSKNFICNDKKLTSNWKGCEDVKNPSDPSDCVLSADDKAHHFEYCCYEKIWSATECGLYSEESRKDEIALIEVLAKGTQFLCTDEEKGSGGFLNISIILLMLIILSI